MMNRYWILIIFLGAFFSSQLQAAACEDIWPDGVQTNSNSGSVTFGSPSQTLNSPDNTLATKTIVNNNFFYPSCGFFSCTASGTIAETGTHSSYPNGSDITLAFQEVRRLSPGAFNSLSTGSQAVLELEPGEYTFKDTFGLGFDAELRVVGAGTVRIFVKKAVSFSSNSIVNEDRADLTSSTPDQLFIYTDEDLTFTGFVEGQGFFYSKKDISVGSTSEIVGGVNAKNITLFGGGFLNPTLVTYDGAALANTDFGGFCTGGSTPSASLVAEYRFDELLWDGSASEVADSSGNGNNGTGLQTDSGVGTLSDGFICRAGTFPDTNDQASYAVETGLDVEVDIGNTGAISIWHRSNTDWDNTGVSKNLWDASSDNATGNDIYFYLLLHNDGRLEFGMEDENDGDYRIVTQNVQAINADSWANVVVNWDVANDADPGEIWVNGVKQAVTEPNDTIVHSRDVGDTFTLYIGDNRSPYNPNSRSNSGADRSADGEIDEVLVYDGVLSELEIADIITKQSSGQNLDGSTRSCPFAPVAQYRFEEESWDGTAGEVTDLSPNGLNGRAINNANTSVTNPAPAIDGSPGTCRYADLLGGSEYIQINDDPILDLETEFTVTTWMYPREFPGSGLHTLVSKDENFEFHVTPSNQINWWWRDSGGATRQIFTTGPALAINTWYHVAIVYRSGEQNIYIDGVQRGVSSHSGQLMVNGDPLLIGTDLNFVPSRNFNGAIDEVHVFDVALTQAEVDVIRQQTFPCSAAPALNHFEVTASSSASTCVPHEVRIKACASASDCSTVLTDYSGTISITTSTNHGRWSKEDAQGVLDPDSDVSDDGAVLYTFSGGSDAGDIILNLSNSRAEDLVVSVTESGTGVADDSSIIEFRDNAFVLTEGGPVVVAGRDQSMNIALHRKDPVTGSCGIATDYEGDRSLKTWLDRSAIDPDGTAPEIDDLDKVPDAIPDDANLVLSFDEGEADFDFITTDVGQYILNFRDDSGTYAGEVINGNTVSLTTRPFGFYITVSSNDATPVANPAAIDSDKAKFIAAGADFTVNAKAVVWQSADDNDENGGAGNGVPDGHGDGDPSNNANLSNNDVTEAFGSNPDDAPQIINLSSYLFLPSSGSAPALDDSANAGNTPVISTFGNGAGGVSSARFDEVGIIEIQSALNGSGGYLGSGATVIGDSGHVGRFIPAYFALSGLSIFNRTDDQTKGGRPDDVTPCADNFTFLGEELSLGFSITAKTLLGNDAENYINVPKSAPSDPMSLFAKLEIALSLGGELSSDTNSLNVIARHNSVDYTAGTCTNCRLDGSTVTPVFTAGQTGALVAPLNFGRVGEGTSVSPYVPEVAFDDVEFAINPIDSDGVEADGDGWGGNHYEVGSSNLYFGRLVVESAYGPENRALPMWVHTEYCAAVDNDGACTNWTDLSRYVASDRCSIFSVTAPAGTEVPEQGYWQGGAIYNNGTASAEFQGFDGVMKRGGGGWLLNYTGGGFGGTYLVPSLGGVLSDVYHPYLILQQGTANFGSYRGNDRIIYWRER